MNAADVTSRRGIAQRADLAVALLVVGVIAMMVVPLPTPLIDLLIALNLCFGVLLIASALYVRDALSFAAFPTLLLLSTLYRLALNVSSTRLILLQADAGQVIESFGHFVVRGDYRVGGLVFAMLTLIQFIVIARGAERVAEVGARFSLDALPGKQMALDAEQRAGVLSAERARAARSRLTRESQLYGAFDGALKFVKGDAIAGVVITLVNFIGGVSIGVLSRDLSLTDSLTTYGLLTIGDGLVTQIPALLGATAAGLVVTRVAPDHGGSLARDLAAQLLDEPRALWVGATVLLGLALVPALPGWPFAAIALACALAALVSHHQHAERRLAVPQALELALGRELAAHLLTRGAPTRALQQALDTASAGVTEALGVSLPDPVVRVDHELSPRALRWSWRELPQPITQLPPGSDLAHAVGQTLTQLGQRRAADCLTLDQVQRMIDQLEQEQPALVRLTMPRPLSPMLLAQVLRLLVREGVSVRWLGEIVEAIAPHARPEARAAELVEHARRALAVRISHGLATQGNLHVLRLSPEVEEALSDAVRKQPGGDVLALHPELAEEIVEAVHRAHQHAPAPHALVTQADLRRHVRDLIAESTPDLSVVSAYELMPDLKLSLSEPIGP